MYVATADKFNTAVKPDFDF